MIFFFFKSISNICILPPFFSCFFQRSQGDCKKKGLYLLQNNMKSWLGTVKISSCLKAKLNIAVFFLKYVAILIQDWERNQWSWQIKSKITSLSSSTDWPLDLHDWTDFCIRTWTTLQRPLLCQIWFMNTIVHFFCHCYRQFVHHY